MMRRSSNQEKEFTFAWSFMHEVGTVPANVPTLPPTVAVPNTLWSMPPVTLTEKERLTNATTILSILCESAVLEPYLKSLLSAK